MIPRSRRFKAYIRRRYRWLRVLSLTCGILCCYVFSLNVHTSTVNFLFGSFDNGSKESNHTCISNSKSHNKQECESPILEDHDHFRLRVLLQAPNQTNVNEPDTNVNESDTNDESQYPTDLFTEEQLKQGAIVLHFIGMIYMFIALAIVCDEFFVPALDVIIEKLQVSEDVAGATFMAAGGSAPELFTSLIGVFFSHSDVGVGTIVGSAVFNILFVIGACSLLSKEVLTLTWWPLFRDCLFYSIAVVLLIVFFVDGEIQPYESLILFLCYISYCCFMKANPYFEAKLQGKNVTDVEASVIDNQSEHTEQTNRESVADSVADSATPVSILSIVAVSTASNKFSRLRYNSKTSKRVRPLAGGMLVSHKSKIDIKDKDATTTTTTKSTTQTMTSSTSYDSRRDDFCSTKRSSDKSHRYTTVKTRKSHTTVRTIKSGNTLINLELQAGKIPITCDMSSPAKGKKSTHKSGGAGMFPVPFDNYLTDIDIMEQKEQQEQEDKDQEEPGPMDMSCPHCGPGFIRYIIVFPIAFPLWVTLPDVRNPNRRNCFAITFIGSIVWIAIYSYLMVWWADTFGRTVGMSPEIMGLTLLAAGTSVPDLITSVLVARRGFGDMAVSSSVGSNIFDITVGLPVPWLIYHAINNFEPYKVKSDDLLCSIAMLFIMLIAVISSIAISGWKMSKTLGVAMIMLYVVFAVISVLIQTGTIDCPKL